MLYCISIKMNITYCNSELYILVHLLERDMALRILWEWREAISLYLLLVF